KYSSVLSRIEFENTDLISFFYNSSSRTPKLHSKYCITLTYRKISDLIFKSFLSISDLTVRCTSLKINPWYISTEGRRPIDAVTTMASDDDIVIYYEVEWIPLQNLYSKNKINIIFRVDIFSS
ncbi:hypothetical protein L9F63_019204, partial [Diploptera punctata]